MSVQSVTWFSSVTGNKVSYCLCYLLSQKEQSLRTLLKSPDVHTAAFQQLKCQQDPNILALHWGLVDIAAFLLSNTHPSRPCNCPSHFHFQVIETFWNMWCVHHDWKAGCCVVLAKSWAGFCEMTPSKVHSEVLHLVSISSHSLCSSLTLLPSLNPLSFSFPSMLPWTFNLDYLQICQNFSSHSFQSLIFHLCSVDTDLKPV